MSKVIIGIHGLGNKPGKDTLYKWWMLAMKEGLEKMDKKVEMPSFELVYWADILNEKPLDESILDKDDLYYLEDQYLPAPCNYKPTANLVRQRILDILKKHMDKILLKEDFTINYAFLAESIINKYFHELKVYFCNEKTDPGGKFVNARDRIRKRVIDALNKYEGHEILLVTHSMGSVIAYDVLNFILPEFKIHTFVTMGSPLGLPVIISKIAACDHFKLKKEKVLTAPPGVFKNWLNFSDPDDSVAFDPTLNDDYAPNEYGVRAEDFLVHNNYINNGERNPHKSFGYLRTPEFSEALYNFITVEEERTFYKKLIAFFKKAS